MSRCRRRPRFPWARRWLISACAGSRSARAWSATRAPADAARICVESSARMWLGDVPVALASERVTAALCQPGRLPPGPRPPGGDPGALRLAGPAAALDRFPAPAVVVLADDGLPVAGYPVGTVVALAAELAWRVALPAVGQRVAGHRGVGMTLASGAATECFRGAAEVLRWRHVDRRSGMGRRVRRDGRRRLCAAWGMATGWAWPMVLLAAGGLLAGLRGRGRARAGGYRRGAAGGRSALVPGTRRPGKRSRPRR